jgi:hypothetical protein
MSHSLPPCNIIGRSRHSTPLRLHLSFTIQLTDDKDKHVAKLSRKTLWKVLPEIDMENRAGDVRPILRLNAAGRRYLVPDGSSISKGVKVLSSVNDDNNCVCLHLLENPRLCDRATELPSSCRMLSKATATRRVQLQVIVVVVEKSGSKPFYKKARNPAGD